MSPRTASVRRVFEPRRQGGIPMTTNPARKIFVNLAVRDLGQSKAFFSKLGFGFNAQFTNETCACMIISEEAYVMLLLPERFKEFARKPVSDAATQTEALYCVSAGSRA